MPRIYDYERYIGSDKERQQLEADVQAGKVSLSVGSTFMVTDGTGKIIDVYIWDGTRFNIHSLTLQVAAEINQRIDGLEAPISTPPVVGVKTVTATAAEIFAGASAKSNRRKLILKNEDPVLRFRIGPSTVTQQNGFPVEPGAVVEIQFDPSTYVPIYAISEGASLQVAVMEI